MINKYDLFHAVKKAYLACLEDEDRSELTAEEVETIYTLIEEIAEEATPDIFLGDAVDEILDRLIDLVPRIREPYDRADEIMEEMNGWDDHDGDTIDTSSYRGDDKWPETEWA